MSFNSDSPDDKPRAPNNSPAEGDEVKLPAIPFDAFENLSINVEDEGRPSNRTTPLDKFAGKGKTNTSNENDPITSPVDKGKGKAKDGDGDGDAAPFFGNLVWRGKPKAQDVNEDVSPKNRLLPHTGAIHRSPSPLDLSGDGKMGARRGAVDHGEVMEVDERPSLKRRRGSPEENSERAAKKGSNPIWISKTPTS